MKRNTLLIICVMLGLCTAGCGGKETQTGYGEAVSENEVSDQDEEVTSEAGTQDEGSDAPSEDEGGENGGAATGEASQEIFAMDTYMTVTAYGAQAGAAVEEAVGEIERLEDLLSTNLESSQVAQLNQNGSGTLSEDTVYLMERSLELYQDTDGIFDVAIYPVMQAWGFTTDSYAVPSDETLGQLLPLTDASKIEFDKDSGYVTFEQEGMQIDFGGIAKGYTSSRIMDIFRKYNIKSGLVNLGGNVQVLGAKTDGSKWRVAIQSPDEDGSYLGVLETEDQAVITSGGYERYFEQDGITYHHIIDPATGKPADSGLVSATVVSADGTLADGLSTSLFIMGEEKAEEYWRKHSDEFEAVLLTEDGVLHVTEGIADAFTSELQVERIEKDG